MSRRIRLRAHGHLARYVGDTLQLETGERVADVLAALGITWGEVGVIAVNGRLADEDTLIRDGDELEMFSPMGGGGA